jgi:GPH family glycoside/pentoside/hexuronide:cation symporter
MPQPLTLREKWGYGVADIGASLSYATINFFLLFFLVEVVGLRPALAGLVLLIGRVTDAITDPIMGMITDRTKSRWGRRKPYIWAGAIPFGITFALLWTVPSDSQMVMFLLASLAIILHTALVYTIVQVPYMALTPELAPSYNERTALTSYRIGFGTLASLMAAALPPLLVATLNSRQGLPQDDQSGWIWMGIIFGALMSLSYLTMAASVRERRTTHPSFGALNLWQEYRSAFGVFGYPQVLLLFVVVTIGLGIVSSILPFYLTSAIRLAPAEQTAVLGLLFGVAILALPIWGLVSARVGKKAAFATGLVILSLSLVLLVQLSPPGGLSSTLLFFSVLAGIGTATVLLFPWAMIPDVVEFDELKTGKRREGLLYAIFTFGQKVAFSLGAFMNAQMLELVGYRRDLVEQSAQTISGIQLMVGPAAALMFILAALVVLRYPITQARHLEVRKALEDRRNHVASPPQ